MRSWTAPAAGPGWNTDAWSGSPKTPAGVLQAAASLGHMPQDYSLHPLGDLTITQRQRLDQGRMSQVRETIGRRVLAPGPMRASSAQKPAPGDRREVVPGGVTGTTGCRQPCRSPRSAPGARYPGTFWLTCR